MERVFKGIIIFQCLVAILILVVPIIGLVAKIKPVPLEMLDSQAMLSPLLLSIASSLFSTIIALLLGLGVSYILVFKEIPFGKPLNTLVTLPMVLPPSVAGYLLLITFGRNGLIGTFLSHIGIEIMFTKSAIILAQIFVILPFVVNSFRTSFEEINPDYIKVAEVFGATEAYAFFRVILPLARGGIFTGAILAFARAMGEFGATMLVSGLNETMTIAIYKNAMSGKRMEANILSLILIIVSFAILQISGAFSMRNIEAGSE